MLLDVHLDYATMSIEGAGRKEKEKGKGERRRGEKGTNIQA
jgi:hypothetical protein